ncbi:hypothetical protein BG53_10940 [Paenibacillus darwinianus]|uniref:Uncharacterized protein n=1 Tax=Paenibacillus darwinianus TaxID=1380763 RepID=A0A9W5RYM4_9BACL|nr:hypothetical protein [Paenibacillus darwinianus]EXX84589.1 hypothetical protein BG53_10940 [Paenibacillus darwinianus]EXX84631.1 hypothetical protein CH50_11355 [Paenibacillus darwinianus]EXX84765.1 hypothetical protein BG52_09905 [Paenibacillus darwinianus]
MSRLNEFVENHEQLDTINVILKHYGVSAEFVAETLTEGFGEDKELPKELVEDLKQFNASL